MTSYLKSHGVKFFYNTKVVDVKFDINGERKQASSIVVESDGQQETINLTENDLLFITNGGCVENSSIGSQNEAAKFDPELKPGNSCGRSGSPRRTRASATRTSSSMTRSRPTGRARPSPRWTRRFRRISRRSASATRSPATPSPAALSP